MSNLFKCIALMLIGATVVAMESDSRIEDRLESFKAKSNQLLLAESGLNCARSIRKDLEEGTDGRVQMVFKQSTKYFSEYSTHLNVPKELHGEFLDLVKKCEAHYLAKIKNELTNQEK